MELEYYNSLSILPLTFSDNNNIIRDNYRIILKGNEGWEHCLIGNPMEEGVFRLNLICYGDFFVGLIDSSQKLPSNKKSICENHIGLLFYQYFENFFIFFFLIFVGVGISQGLFYLFYLFYGY